MRIGKRVFVGMLALVSCGSILLPANTGVASVAGSCGDRVKRIEPTGDPIEGSQPVLFVHGIMSDAKRWDNDALSNSLDKIDKVSAWTFDYGDVSLEWVTNDNIGPAFADAITCVREQTGRNVVVVAHSMGGLVTQFAVSQESRHGYPVSEYVDSVVTIGTPFKGSKFLSIAQRVLAGGRDVRPVESLLYKTVRSICSARSDKNQDFCGIVRAPDSPIGEALREGSPQLAALPEWPGDLQVKPVGGDVQASIGVDFLNLRATQSFGDPVVAMESAVAHHVEAEPARYRCRSTVPNFSSICTHFNLPKKKAVQEIIARTVQNARKTSGQSPERFFTRSITRTATARPSMPSPPSVRVRRSSTNRPRWPSRRTGAGWPGSISATAPPPR